MERLNATLRDFIESVAWLKSAPSVAEKMGKVFGFVCMIGGVSLAVASRWVAELSPFAPWAVSFVAVYFTWHFSISWNKNSGPLIWIGDKIIGYESSEQKAAISFEIKVRNDGQGEIDAFLYVTDITDASGRRLSRLNESPVPWRDAKESFLPKILYGGREGIANVITISRPVQGRPEHHVSIGNYSVSFEKLSATFFTIRVDFHEKTQPYKEEKTNVSLDKDGNIRSYSLAIPEKGAFIKSKAKRFRFRLDETSPELCQITNA